MTTDTKQNPAGERMEEPAKRWFNWWRHTADWTSSRGDSYRVGDVPAPKGNGSSSKDICETHAYEWLAKYGRHGLAEFLGAFPEGQRP